MFAAIDNWIILLIFAAVSMVVSWLQKRQRQGQDEEETPSAPPNRRPDTVPSPAPPPGRPAPKPLSWEEELRRLLEGQTAEPPSAPPPPPPIPTQARRPAVPPPMPAPEPKVRSHAYEHSPVEVAFTPLQGLTESTQAIDEAVTLEERVRLHLRQVTQKPVGTTQVRHLPASANAAQLHALIRDPKSVRTAVLASIVLGPPRALAE
jgi:hypothetical protein